MDKFRVFVYGTLLTGEHNNCIMSSGYYGQANKLGEDSINGFKMYSLGGFPAIIPGQQEDWIIGEVWEVDEEVFESLDALEGYPTMYNRVQVITEYGQAWVYTMTVANDRWHPIESGSWKQHKAKLLEEK